MLLCQVVSAQPEQFFFGRLTDQDGLPNNGVRKVIQSRDGLLWIACTNGLARYDGYKVKVYRNDPSDSTTISANLIVNLYEDSRNRLWVSSTGHGISLSDPLKSSYRKLQLSNDTILNHAMNVREIAEDSTHLIWMLTNEGLFLIREEREIFTSVDAAKIFPLTPCDFPPFSTTILTSRDGTMWVGTREGLYRMDTKNQKVYCPQQFNGLPAYGINALGYDRLGRLWVSCNQKNDRLYFEDTPNHFKSFTGIPFDTTFRDAEFAFDLDNRLWVSVFGDQVYGYDFRDSTLFLQSSLNPEIGHERFYRNPFVDSSGMVWLLAEGLYYYPYPKGFRHYKHPYTFHQSNSEIFISKDAYWFAYREKGLVRIDKKTNERVHMSSEQEGKAFLPEDLIVGILELHNGHTMLVCFNVIIILDKEANIIAQHEIVGTNRSALQDSKSRIWIGGISGLHLFSEELGVIKSYKLPSVLNDNRNFIQAMAEDKHGNIWFVSDNKGVAQLNPETEEIRHFLQRYGDTNSLPSNSVNDILIDPQNFIWLATDNGLVQMDPATEKMISINYKEGLASNYISSIVQDDVGIIWLATQSGISSFNPNTQQIVNYNRADGLNNGVYYDRAKHITADGIIYFGGMNGVDYFNPHQLRSNPTSPKLKLVSFNSIHHGLTASHLSTDDVRLSYNDDLIEIEFTGIHYSDQTSVQYMYKLEPLHEDWIQLGDQHTVLFSNLKPGKYVFHAKAVTADEVSSKADLVIPIYVSPPFYQTAWFRLLMLALIGGAIFWYIKYRETMAENRQKKESEISRQILELEKRALQAQMNPHFIYNSMNSIQQFIIVHDVEGAMKYLTRFSRILRTVLNMSAQSRIPLYEEIKLIEDYLELENMRFPNKFTYEIKVSPELNIHSAEIPPFFIQPQVENAIRHGLLKKSTPGHLSVEIKKDGEHLMIIVEDNGIGRVASQQMKYTDSKTHVSKGLSIVEERLRHMGSTNGHQPFKITDLYDRMQQPLGTRVEITLPMD